MKKCNLFIISGPSGSGKSTICDNIISKNPDIKYVVSHTTRSIRYDEKNNVDYRFVTEDSFIQLIDDGHFIEWANVHGKYYGTSFDSLNSILDSGYNAILIIDVQGMKQLKLLYPNATTIFIDTPSVEELEKRLMSRGTESMTSLKMRLENSIIETKSKMLYDHYIVNDNINDAIAEVETIITGN